MPEDFVDLNDTVKQFVEHDLKFEADVLEIKTLERGQDEKVCRWGDRSIGGPAILECQEIQTLGDRDDSSNLHFCQDQRKLEAWKHTHGLVDFAACFL
jgi:hypothetical protein